MKLILGILDNVGSLKTCLFGGNFCIFSSFSPQTKNSSTNPQTNSKVSQKPSKRGGHSGGKKKHQHQKDDPFMISSCDLIVKFETKLRNLHFFLM